MIPQDKQHLAVVRIREQYQNQVRSLYFFTAYFFLTLATRAYAVVEHWAKSSSVEGMGVEVALALLSVVAIPILIIRIKKLKAIDYSIPVEELIGQACRRFRPLASTLLTAGIALSLVFLIALTVDGGSWMSTPIRTLVDSHLPLLLGVLTGLVFGCAVYYVQRRKFIRSITNL